MTSVTVSVDQLLGWATTAYLFLHVIFGLVTHYHSSFQVRKHNANLGDLGESHRIGPFKIFLLFAGRMTLGFPWFLVSRIVAPIRNYWHWTPKQIRDWGA